MKALRSSLFVFTLLTLAACNKNKNKTIDTVSDPILTTSAVSNITSNSATSGGDVMDAANGHIISRGICWSINQFPTVDDPSDGKVMDNAATLGTFALQATGLLPNKTYYLRAFATNEQGTGYGDHLVFTTLP